MRRHPATVPRRPNATGLIALAIAVAGLLGAFAIYTFGWHDHGSRRRAEVASVRTTTNAGGTQRIYTLRDGDVAVRPEAAVRCEASGEGGRPNLFCMRIGGGRHQVIFYRDDVIVWPLASGPDGPAFVYHWTPKRSKR